MASLILAEASRASRRAPARSLRLQRLLPALPPLLLPPLLLLLLLASSTARGVQGAHIKLVNACDYPLTAFARAGPGPLLTKALPPKGGSHTMDLTPSGGLWIGGVIWASRTGNINNGEATQIEFTIGADIGQGLKQDFYDLSLVNAFNEPVQIIPIDPPAPKPKSGGRWCGAPACAFPGGAKALCLPPNQLLTREGGDAACINTHGPGLVETEATKAFKKGCPAAYSYSKDDPSSMFACAWGTSYEVRFCPGSPHGGAQGGPQHQGQGVGQGQGQGQGKAQQGGAVKDKAQQTPQTQQQTQQTQQQTQQTQQQTQQTQQTPKPEVKTSTQQQQAKPKPTSTSSSSTSSKAKPKPRCAPNGRRAPASTSTSRTSSSLRG
ncbi:hypothetical protein HYH03_018594 [Edaphochlamys debaryana]|uniref:Thaumatin-like protein n=1 Tax=Edaphochlamys debaryana TaxID=47281 RepID=A0A836BN58_9CHLO|nr:hypothetical protein HYH03_018594 [Edaphochlamys debaryana]|eukprot:KAG2482487.1 hypothetical protein HYH03_018594 [Edaphochlamys debaryana]